MKIGNHVRLTDLWRTPLNLFSRLDAEFNFRLDAACTTENCLTSQGLYYDQGRNGLTEDWGPPGTTVWCNPPYSQSKLWVKRGSEQGRSRTVVMLVPADTSTRWWLEEVSQNATEIRFLTGRPRFRRPEGDTYKPHNGGGGGFQPSAILVFTPLSGPPTYSYIPHTTEETPRIARKRPIDSQTTLGCVLNPENPPETTPDP